MQVKEWVIGSLKAISTRIAELEMDSDLLDAETSEQLKAFVHIATGADTSAKASAFANVLESNLLERIRENPEINTGEWMALPLDRQRKELVGIIDDVSVLEGDMSKKAAELMVANGNPTFSKQTRLRGEVGIHFGKYGPNAEKAALDYLDSIGKLEAYLAYTRLGTARSIRSMLLKSKEVENPSALALHIMRKFSPSEMRCAGVLPVVVEMVYNGHDLRAVL